jgi:hypothetical protein
MCASICRRRHVLTSHDHTRCTKAGSLPEVGSSNATIRESKCAPPLAWRHCLATFTRLPAQPWLARLPVGSAVASHRVCGVRFLPDGGPPRQHPAVGVRGSIPRVGPRSWVRPVLRGFGLALRTLAASPPTPSPPPMSPSRRQLHRHRSRGTTSPPSPPPPSPSHPTPAHRRWEPPLPPTLPTPTPPPLPSSSPAAAAAAAVAVAVAAAPVAAADALPVARAPYAYPVPAVWGFGQC